MRVKYYDKHHTYLYEKNREKYGYITNPNIIRQEIDYQNEVLHVVLNIEKDEKQ